MFLSGITVGYSISCDSVEYTPWDVCFEASVVDQGHFSEQLLGETVTPSLSHLL